MDFRNPGKTGFDVSEISPGTCRVGGRAVRVLFPPLTLKKPQLTCIL